MSLYSVIQQTTNVSFSFFSRNMIFIYTHIIYVSIYLSGHILFSHISIDEGKQMIPRQWDSVRYGSTYLQKKYLNLRKKGLTAGLVVWVNCFIFIKNNVKVIYTQELVIQINRLSIHIPHLQGHSSKAITFKYF